MRRRILSLFLTFIMVVSLLPASAIAAGDEREPIPSDYFYSQLNERAKAIYKLLLDKFTGASTKETYYDGKESIDLIQLKDVITEEDIDNYLKGNKDIFNDFCAAKDALDLDHSELWYLDSSYLTFRVTKEGNDYHVWVGPGRADNYLLAGKSQMKAGTTVKAMDAEVEKVINQIVDTAKKDLATADKNKEYSDADKTAALVRSVHDQITQTISYRFENECTQGTGNEKYIRTLYALVTHQGVCEAYSRAMQVCLTRLGIKCVLVHGLQTSGTPEDHMWNAVRIDDTVDGKTVERWYVVDATWDDPLPVDWYGKRVIDDSTHGDDGRENTTYLLVGQCVVGANWVPSGFVSTGEKEFTYPTIENSSYDGSTAFTDESGLKVMYSAGSGSMEDGTPAGVFTATFKGMNAEQARKKGFYFIIKMSDYHPDGTSDVMQEWYYCDATIALTGSNPYFGDTPNGLRVYSATCEYVELAVTTREPNNFDSWTKPGWDWSYHWEDGFFQGTDADIIAQSGMLYNINSKYEAPPYVYRQYPAPNGMATAGVEYRVSVLWDDELYHPILDAETPTAVEDFVDNTQQAAKQEVRVRYATYQDDLSNPGNTLTVQLAGELPFDTNRDGYVDMGGDYTDFQWHYKYTKETCKNTKYHEANPDKECDVNQGCVIDGVDFNFRASDMWADDITEYNFSVEGVIGSRSSKFPNNFAFVCSVPGLCPACYRSQGIDWNLWGKPTLLDAPSNLDLEKMTLEGVQDAENLKELQEQMHIDNLNGRLMLVVEDNSKGSGNREEYTKVNDALENELDIADSDIKSSSVYEINFNRICPMVKLQPGQSLRVQVGYPAGITYEMLGKDVVLKAYHFTRCDAKVNKDCPNKDKEGHVWGEDILGVNEIQMIPTPYGIVIMCDSFSPFEIVVLDAKSEAVQAVVQQSEFQTTGKIVTVVSDENGCVEVDGKTAVGEDGFVEFKAGETKEFTVVPNKDYVVDTVSFGGKSIEVTDNKFTLSATDVTTNDILSVTFLPEVIKEEETKKEITTVVTAACSHTETEDIPEDGKVNKEATCTEDGYALGTKCKKCGQRLSEGHVIPATGHTIEVKEKEVPATCTTAGTRAVAECTVCHKKISNGERIDPLGHSFTKYTVVEDAEVTCQGVLKRATCDRDGCNEVDELRVPDITVDHEFTKYVSDHNATCTQDGTKTAHCDYNCGATTTITDTGSATGHDFDEATHKCKNCGMNQCQEHHTEEVMPAVEPTCTENGLTEGKRCSVCGEVLVHQTILLAKGHTFDPATHKCTVCGQEQVNTEHTPETIKGYAPTCDAQGLTDGTRCKYCGQIIEAQEIIPATGHDWDTENVQWDWSETDGVSAVAIFTCKTDGTHTHTEKATLAEEVVTAATCTTEGSGTYTATVVFHDTTFTDTDEGKTLITPALGHDFSDEPIETTPATCTHLATEVHKCSRCDETETKTVGELAAHSYVYEAHNDATCTENGTKTGTCTVCGNTVVEDNELMPALGHDYVDGKCTRCGEEDPDYVAPDPDPDPDPDPNPGPSVPDPDPTPSVPTPSVGSTVTNPDGSRTTTTMRPDGSRTKTTTTKAGVVGKADLDASGRLTGAQVTIPAASAEKITAPIEVGAVKNSKDAPKIDITLQDGGTAQVEIPVSNVTPGTVAVLVSPDGTETVIRECVVSKDGVVLNVTGSATIKIVENGRTFADVADTYWGSDAVTFATARGLFNGTGKNLFSPESDMSRGMLATVLYRLAYEPEAGAAAFADVDSGAYYAEAVSWASAEGIVNGYSANEYGPDNPISREQLVTMLYRYAKNKGYDLTVTAGVTAAFPDAGAVSSYAADAMNWAVGSGLINGSGGLLDPAGHATRAQVAAVLMRFCENVLR